MEKYRSGSKPKIDWKGNTKRMANYLLATAVLLVLAGCASAGRPRPEPVTVPQVISMVKEGIPTDDIIADMKASGTVYRLKATQLARLEKEGVPGKIINYMQQTYLDAVNQESRYRGWGYWSREDDFCWYGGPPCGWHDYP